MKGIMVVEVEVDDLLTLGDEAHFAKMQELQPRFKFGKFKFLDEEQQGVSFNGRRLRMSMAHTTLICRSSLKKGCAR